MTADEKVLRGLATLYRAYAQEEHNAECARLHRAGNDLHMIRPVVLIDELPWNEMELEDELTLRCTDPFLRETEQFLRREIYKYEHLRADMVLRPFVPVQKVVTSTGYGMQVREAILATAADNGVVSHEYVDQLRCDADLEKLHEPVITYDARETHRRVELLGNMIGDLIPVRAQGYDAAFWGPWERISELRGVTPLLMDLALEPEFSHRVVQKFVQIEESINRQYLELGLFEAKPWSLHCTPAFTDDLKGDPAHMTTRDIWGRGRAQIFASVSGQMLEEYEINYMIPTLGQYGLVYYGCCEPLDQKMDVVEKLPNLRKVSITPWANVDRGAEAIGSKYVLANKPNPAAVAAATLDEEALKKEIGRTLTACRRNNCSFELVLKDISTCCGHPRNIFRWEQIVMDMVRSF